MMYNQKPVKHDSFASIYQLAPTLDLLHLREPKARNILQSFSDEVAACKQIEEELFLLAEALPQMVWITRPDGFVEYFNQRWYDYTGLTSEQTQGDGWSESLHPVDRSRTIAFWHTAARTGFSYEIEYRVKHGATGEYRWFLARGVPFKDAQGKVVKWVGTCTDIHDKQQLEHRKDEFISIAGHELKTPLTALGLLVARLKRKIRREDNMDAETDLARMEGQIETMTRLLHDLLDVSKIQLGRFDYDDELIDLDALVCEVADTFQQTTATHTIQVHGKLETPLVGDRNRLEQIVTNLISNALKYSPQADAVDIYLSQEKETALIRVQDYGVGIPREQQSAIFERFNRGAYTRREKAFPGLGMGLYIAHEIIKHYHGGIGVESEEGKGTTFVVSLPLRCG